MKMMMYCRGGSKDDSDSDDGHHYDEEGDNDEFYDDDADDDCDEGFPVLAAVWCHREHLVPLSPLGCTLSTANCECALSMCNVVQCTISNFLKIFKIILQGDFFIPPPLLSKISKQEKINPH